MTPVTSPEAPVSWQALVWILIALAINSMAQPSGRICGARNYYRIYLSSSPIVCVADALSMLIGFALSWRHISEYSQAARLVLMHRFDCRIGKQEVEQHTWPRLIIFILGVLPAAIKLCSLTGVPWTKAWGLMFVVSFVSIEIMALLFQKISPQYTEDVSGNTMVYEYRDPRTFERKRILLSFQVDADIETPCAKVHSLLGLESPADLNDPRYRYHGEKISQIIRAKETLSSSSTTLLTLALLEHVCLLTWDLKPIFLNVMGIYNDFSIPHFNAIFSTLLALLHVSAWLLLTATIIRCICSFKSPSMWKYTILLWKVVAFSRLLPRVLGYWWSQSAFMSILFMWTYVAILNYFTYKGTVWVCDRYPRLSGLLGIGKGGKEEEERRQNAWLALWLFCGNLVVCVSWYASEYDAVGTVNPSWTSVFGK